MFSCVSVMFKIMITSLEEEQACQYGSRTFGCYLAFLNCPSFFSNHFNIIACLRLLVVALPGFSFFFILLLIPTAKKKIQIYTMCKACAAVITVQTVTGYLPRCSVLTDFLF